MSEFGGEIYGPDEGAGGAPEELSEEAKQRFAAAAAGMKQIRKEEKKKKKRDDQVAKTIMKFLGSSQKTQLFLLISRLVSRNCPSIFILAILSLIDQESNEVVAGYLEESAHTSAEKEVDESMALTNTGELDGDSNRAMIEWITRMQLVLSQNPEGILTTLMIDDKNIDGTVLQLTTFVLQDFFQSRNRSAEFEKLQPLTASILQTVFQPFLGSVQKILLDRARQEQAGEAEDGDEDEM